MLTGVCLSGGGSRAYVAGLAQLRALDELGLKADRVAGVSGGCWAIVAKSCCEEEQPLYAPAQLNMARLRELPATRQAPHLAVARADLLRLLLKHMVWRGKPPYEAWRAALHETILEPLGLEENAALEQLEQRRMESGTACTPQIHVGAAVLGACADAPFDVRSRAFRYLDINADMMALRMPVADARQVAVSAAAVPPPTGGRPRRNQKRALRLSDDESDRPFAIADMLAVSSFFPGAPLQTETGAAHEDTGRPLAGWGSLKRCALAHLASRPWAQLALLDARRARWHRRQCRQRTRRRRAACGWWLRCNLPLPILLAEGCTEVACMINVGEPLPSASVWDPFESEASRRPPFLRGPRWLVRNRVSDAESVKGRVAVSVL